MDITHLCDFDDVAAAIRENRPLRPARAYRFNFALDGVDFRILEVSDPVPLGRQVLTSAGLDAGDGYSLFAILPTGDFEDVRLDEPFDLRQRGAERFIAFSTDRVFKLTAKDRQLAWGKPVIGGSVLYTLLKPQDDEAVFLEVRGGQDRWIKPEDLIDLTQPGVERFIVGPRPDLTYGIIVNSRPRVVNGPTVSFEQIVQLAFPGTHAPEVVFSMTYRHAASQPHAGELGAGGTVKVKKGTVFNVTRTVKS